jgi:hypothetical protein
MRTSESRVLGSACCGLFLLSAIAQAEAADPLTPEQADSVMTERVRQLLGFGGNASTPFWLSLSTVGAVVPEGDIGAVNDLANFCPEPAPVIQSYRRARLLNRIYFKVVDWLTGPFREPTEEQKKAREYLSTSSDKAKYDEFHKKWTDVVSRWWTETDSAKKAVLFSEKLDVERDWAAFGFRNEVDNAYEVIRAGVNNFAPAINGRRKDILADFEAKGLQVTDNPLLGAYRAPVSELSPSVEKWGDANGWLRFSFSDSTVRDTYSESTSNNLGFQGLSLGFLTVGGGGGGGNTTESKVTKVFKFDYQAELKRVPIRRPWLDTEVFFERTGWTWRKPPAEVPYPHVSVGENGVGQPQQSPDAVIDGRDIGCSLLPLELVIARGRSLTATVSNDDYHRIEESGSSTSGGGLFGFFGGSTHGWKTKNVVTNNDTTTFTVSDPGIAVIGLISEKLPRVPEPNLSEKWPTDAWLP